MSVDLSRTMRRRPADDLIDRAKAWEREALAAREDAARWLAHAAMLETEAREWREAAVRLNEGKAP